MLWRSCAHREPESTEGDPLGFCEATLRVSDPDGADPRWFEHVTTHGMQRIRATLRLEGDELHLDTNSEARLDRVLGTLRTLQPMLTVIDEARRPAHEIVRPCTEPACQ